MMTSWALERTRVEAPNPKLQAPEKLQTSSSNSKVGRRSPSAPNIYCSRRATRSESDALPSLEFGAWDFVGAWSLGFGASPLHSLRDSQHHLRLVGHARGRSARGLEGDELRAGPGAADGADARAVSRGVLSAVHDFLRQAH